MTEGTAAKQIIKSHGYEMEFTSYGKINFYTTAPWQPDIYTVTDNNRPAAFEIQTSSYGALGVQELRCMITGLVNAVAMVTELNVLFGLGA